ncbi:ras guanine nucleotide exchange factor i-related [Anaeramoeba flamelloides]|uniref:Ras guanine nucleotide exchange factor i-related n=1 Tax=Anaeramoeba flamelloides TaxID=1746091 RepID=A0AAV7ZP04_9EUKA|nr:ras guanine nucleotide exchange factor i-related [Anaeramoeba flamelloides]
MSGSSNTSDFLSTLNNKPQKTTLFSRNNVIQNPLISTEQKFNRSTYNNANTETNKKEHEEKNNQEPINNKKTSLQLLREKQEQREKDKQLRLEIEKKQKIQQEKLNKLRELILKKRQEVKKQGSNSTGNNSLDQKPKQQKENSQNESQPNFTPKKILHNEEKETSKDFNKFYSLQGYQKPLVRNSNIDRSTWKKRALEKHKNIKELRECIYPTERMESFIKIFNPGQKQVSEKLTNDTVTQLIMHHLVALGYQTIIPIIEKETQVKYQPKYLLDSRLHTLIRSAVIQTEKIWDLLYNENFLEEESTNQLNEMKITRENPIVEHFVDLGLSQVDEEESDEEEYSNIWEEPENEKYILYSENEGSNNQIGIRAATLNKLIAKLTDENSVDIAFLKTFLLTYQSITSSRKVLSKLIQRFHVPRTKEMSDEQYEIKKRNVHIRVANLLKIWISKYLIDPDKKFLQYLKEFIKEDLHQSLPSLSELLISKIETIEKQTGKQKIVKFTEKPPQPIVPKNIFSQTLSIFDVNELEVARQITLIEQKIYSKIKPRELLNLAWSKAKYRHRAQNVLRFIQHFNQLSGWVSTEIIKGETIRKRVSTVIYFINLAEHLRKLNNFDSLIAVLSGLKSSAVYRLKFTFQDLPTKQTETKNRLDSEMSSEQSYKKYRGILHAANPPCIPYLGVYLTDLTFIEDGNPNKINGLINFSKRQLVYTVIEENQRYQSKPYSLQPVHQIATRLEKLQVTDHQELYKKSLKREPRKSNREDIL